ncbi:MAG: segregation and condensation protein A [Opitutales bacterium]
MEEALIPNNEFAVSLPAFEGPLDLLLYLIRRNEVDIYDIPIETVTRQYIEILGSMEELDLEIAGEFFVMAATLMYIKSRLLLPKKDQGANEDVEDESIDPRWELVQRGRH